VKRKKLNLYRLPPKNFEGREDVIVFSDLSKVYNLEGREEKVVALKSVSLAPKSEFYPIKR
jgi:putative ABC transport system ATP-binding protein